MWAVGGVPVRVLLLKWQVLVGKELRLILARERQLAIAAVAASGTEGLALLRDLGGVRGVDVVVAGDDLLALVGPVLARRMTASSLGVSLLLLAVTPKLSAG